MKHILMLLSLVLLCSCSGSRCTQEHTQFTTNSDGTTSQAQVCDKWSNSNTTQQNNRDGNAN